MRLIPAAVLAAAAAVLMTPATASAQRSSIGAGPPIRNPLTNAAAVGFIASFQPAPVAAPNGLGYPPTTLGVFTLVDGQRVLVYRFTRIDTPQPAFTTGSIFATGYRRADGTLVATRIILQ